MADRAFRSSCLAMNGQRIQLMTTALTVPTRKARPRVTAINAVAEVFSTVTSDSEITVKEMHPAIPER